MTCALASHQLGWELRLAIGADFYRSEVCRTEPSVFEVAEAWRMEAEGKGWAPR